MNISAAPNCKNQITKYIWIKFSLADKNLSLLLQTELQTNTFKNIIKMKSSYVKIETPVYKAKNNIKKTAMYKYCV